MKKVLFISHQLSRTGAPLVLLSMISCFHREGYGILVISLEDGELRSDLESLGIPVRIFPQLSPAHDSLIRVFQGFDLIVVNTLVAHEAIPICMEAGTPTIWWVHEHEGYFDHYAKELPSASRLTGNIRIYGVSPVTKELLSRKTRYPNVGLLPFGIDDPVRSGICRPAGTDGPIRFLCIGLFTWVKGQDLLCQAIRQLPQESRLRCEFDFYGDLSEVDNAVFKPVKEASRDFDNVRFFDAVPHDELLKEIAHSDYVIVPSRKEPMSAVAIEAMSLSVPAILSDVCGVAYYINDRENGLLFSSGSIPALTARIIDAISLHDTEGYTALSSAARSLYEQQFSMDVFSTAVLSLADSSSHGSAPRA